MIFIDFVRRGDGQPVCIAVEHIIGIDPYMEEAEGGPFVPLGTRIHCTAVEFNVIEDFAEVRRKIQNAINSEAGAMGAFS